MLAGRYGRHLDIKAKPFSKETNGPETLDFAGFQAQKKTSVDVFR